MADNFIIMMWGLVKKFLTILFFILMLSNYSFALDKVGIITDTILSKPNYYTAYYSTPEFFAQDIRAALFKKNVDVLPIDTTKRALYNIGLKQNNIQSLQGLQQGYNIDYSLLKKISNKMGVTKMIIVTMGIDVQRDFLKNTLWNSANVPGFDVVNPTHRVSVYVALVDVKNEIVLWESIYAKNIRNNKMKNLDTTVSNNYEGMLRLKEYSKYISPDIAYNVKMKLINPNYVEPMTIITRDNVRQYVKDKHNIGVKKELSEIDRVKWDSQKFTTDTKATIKDKCDKFKNGVENAAKATGNGIKNGVGAVGSVFEKKSTQTEKNWL